MPVRLGVPQYVEGLSDVVRNPIHATGVGLLLYGMEAYQTRAESSTHKAGLSGGFGGVWDRMKAWFQGNF